MRCLHIEVNLIGKLQIRYILSDGGSSKVMAVGPGNCRVNLSKCREVFKGQKSGKEMRNAAMANTCAD